MPKMTMNVNVPVEHRKEGDVIVAFCPLLDIASQGCTEQEANSNLVEAIGLFLVTSIEMGTFSQVIKDCGFRTNNLNQQATDNDGEHLNVVLPFIAERELAGCHA